MNKIRITVFLFVVFLFSLVLNNTIFEKNAYANGPSGTYNITSINAFSSSFRISLDGINDATYFNIFKLSNDTYVNPTPELIENSINSIPAVYANIADLEVRVFSDSAGYNLVAEFTLNSSNQLILKSSSTTAASLAITAPSKAIINNALSITVTAKDKSGNIATGYQGVVQFTCSDNFASLPSDYTFTSADNGIHTFNITLKTSGPQSVTVTDLTNGKLNATVVITASTHQEDSEIINYPSKSNVPSDKTWTIKCNGELDLSINLGNYVSVTDSQDNVVSVVATLGSDGKSIIVNPPQGGYNPGETYTLNIAKGLVSKNAKIMNKSYKMQFTVTGEVVDPLVTATTAVEAAELIKTKDAVDAAQAFLALLPAGTIKDGLQARINSIEIFTADVTVNVSPVIPSFKQITVKQTNVAYAANFSIHADNAADSAIAVIGGTITYLTSANTVKLTILDAIGAVISSGDLNVMLSGDSTVNLTGGDATNGEEETDLKHTIQL
jgi:hypothetical protein